jgi:hypothetical protein
MDGLLTNGIKNEENVGKYQNLSTKYNMVS